MESWTMTEPALSGARGHNDGGRADAALPKGESGIGKGESEVGTETSLADEPTCAAEPEKSTKKGKI